MMDGWNKGVMEYWNDGEGCLLITKSIEKKVKQ